MINYAVVDYNINIYKKKFFYIISNTDLNRLLYPICESKSTTSQKLVGQHVKYNLQHKTAIIR